MARCSLPPSIGPEGDDLGLFRAFARAGTRAEPTRLQRSAAALRRRCAARARAIQGEGLDRPIDRGPSRLAQRQHKAAGNKACSLAPSRWAPWPDGRAEVSASDDDASAWASIVFRHGGVGQLAHRFSGQPFPAGEAVMMVRGALGRRVAQGPASAALWRARRSAPGEAHPLPLAWCADAARSVAKAQAVVPPSRPPAPRACVGALGQRRRRRPAAIRRRQRSTVAR